MMARVAWARRVLAAALVFATVGAREASGQSATEGCPNPPGFYESEGYLVRRIVIESPFDFVGSFRRALEAAKARIPVREGEPYRGADVTKGVAVIEAAADGETVSVFSPVVVTATVAFLADCTQSGAGKSLVVLYRLYTSRFPLSYTRRFEAGPQAAVNPAEGAGVRSRRLIQVEPSIRYDRVDKVVGGVRAASRDLWRIDGIDADVQASTRMQTITVGAADSRALDAVGLNTITWRGDYRYADLPLEEEGARRTHVAGGLFSADFAGLPAGALLRAGAAFEGGRASSVVGAMPLPPDTVAASDLVSVKAFTGVSWRMPRHALNLSYGLQASATGEGFAGGFTKQVLDAAYRARVLPVDHRPIDIDVRFTGGWIVNRGRLPVSERFFGGNVPEEFLPGASWSIRANPLIRSFARSELASDGVYDLGGERFLAFNVTVAHTVWGRPLVPPELVGDTAFQEKVDAQMSNAELALEQHYANRSPAFQAFVAENVERLHETLTVSLETIAAALASLEDSVPADRQERREECDATLTDSTITLDGLEVDGSMTLATVRTLSAPGRLLDRTLGCVDDPAFSAIRDKTKAAAASVREAQTQMRASLALIDEKETAARARAALQPARRVLRTFFHELTLASISPVVLFDAARLGSPGADVRYAVGGGIRLSLVNAVHLTTAYAVNTDRQPGESRGAILFSLDVSEFLF